MSCEDKWDCYKKLVDKMCSEMNEEEAYARCADSLNELAQWCVRGMNSRYTEKSANCMELFKYMTEATINMMLVTKKVDKTELHDMIEDAVLEEVMADFEVH